MRDLMVWVVRADAEIVFGSSINSCQAKNGIGIFLSWENPLNVT